MRRRTGRENEYWRRVKSGLAAVDGIVWDVRSTGPALQLGTGGGPFGFIVVDDPYRFIVVGQSLAGRAFLALSTDSAIRNGLSLVQFRNDEKQVSTKNTNSVSFGAEPCESWVPICKAGLRFSLVCLFVCPFVRLSARSRCCLRRRRRLSSILIIDVSIINK